MEKVENIVTRSFQCGRCVVGRLTLGADLILAVEGYCINSGIQMAMFSIIGAVTSVTLGAYDQNQQVYVTFKKDGHFEIVHCTGNISLKEGKPTMHAHGVFADPEGQTFGGHVFSKTLVYAGEIFLRDLAGTPLEREYDEQTGLYLWSM
jgi:predicted DNA-binding protein with PD1-like motif